MPVLIARPPLANSSFGPRPKRRRRFNSLVDPTKPRSDQPFSSSDQCRSSICKARSRTAIRPMRHSSASSNFFPCLVLDRRPKFRIPAIKPFETLPSPSPVVSLPSSSASSSSPFALPPAAGALSPLPPSSLTSSSLSSKLSLTRSFSAFNCHLRCHSCCLLLSQRRHLTFLAFDSAARASSHGALPPPPPWGSCWRLKMTVLKASNQASLSSIDEARRMRQCLSEMSSTPSI
mmetsp:Transcript_27532/g.59172  ORF Transcript_27532/g.59172 Transcript_27532/m.59172 type:complete len:233 (+) Transcript_27532:218-916(+)